MKFIFILLDSVFFSFKLIVLLYSEKVLLYLYDTKLIPLSIHKWWEVIKYIYSSTVSTGLNYVTGVYRFIILLHHMYSTK